MYSRLIPQFRPSVTTRPFRVNTLKRFPVNSSLLERARAVLCNRPRLYWVLGGACSGKSTLCAYLAKEKGIPIYDMDAHIFGDYAPRYTLQDHPASREWFDQPNPLEWALSLSWQEFDALNAATNVESLDLFAKDVGEMDPDQALVVDGGMAHPALVAQALNPSQLLCLARNPADARRGQGSRRAWETDPARADMKRSVLALPGGEEAWDKFLRFDQCLTETLLDECRQNGIRIVEFQSVACIDQVAAIILPHWQL